VQTTSGPDTNTTTNLIHEMRHGYDANRGLLDDRRVDGQPRSEWQASFRENMVRSQLSNVSARTFYGTVEKLKDEYFLMSNINW